MSHEKTFSRLLALPLAPLLIAASLAGLPAAGQAQNAPRYNCMDTPQHRQFDFWLGKWEVTDKAGETIYGHNEITLAESGCLLAEHWKSSQGGSGSSINYYNPVTDQWHQDWVDAGASIIKTAGGLKDGAMAMQGKIYYMQSGQRADFRGKWTPLEDGRVRQFFQQKDDKGKWNTWFDGYYRRLD